jgi:AcrR family transcriptional regulator
MGRKSQDLDKKLILIGQSLIQEVGVSRVSLREVARLADVNLGMLSYHFKGKEDFIIKCLDNLYAPFIAELETINLDEVKDHDFEQLLFKLGKFSRDNRKIILLLLKDMLSNDEVVKDFISKNFTQHFRLTMKALRSYLDVQDDNHLKIDTALKMIVALVGGPSLMAGFQEIVFEKNHTESDEQLKARIQFVCSTLKKL